LCTSDGKISVKKIKANNRTEERIFQALFPCRSGT